MTWSVLTHFQFEFLTALAIELLLILCRLDQGVCNPVASLDCRTERGTGICDEDTLLKWGLCFLPHRNVFQDLSVGEKFCWNHILWTGSDNGFYLTSCLSHIVSGRDW